MSDAAIHTQGLTKTFRGGQVAVDHLELTVPGGSVFGFLGPNGSGKTTTIRMLMGLIEPTSGTARVLGLPTPRSVRTVLPQVGALIEGPALYGFLSGRDNLIRYDSADPTADPRNRRTRVAAALDRVGLAAAMRQEGEGVLAGHEAAAGPRRGTAPAAPPPRPRRADERSRPAGHARNPRAGTGVGVRRHHRLPFLAPARRDRAGVHPCRRHGQGPASSSRAR